MAELSITTGATKSFKDLLDPNRIYVDKTSYVCELAKSDEQFLLTRPRRMGKSTMVATLEHLFSKGAFSGDKKLAWDGQWTDPYRYFVFRFDWSNFKWSSGNDLEFSFLSSLHVYAKYFGVSLATNITVGEIFRSFILDCLAKLSDKEFLSAHAELANGAPAFCNDKVVLLIDEYDSPLTKSLGEPKIFDELREVYSQIYSTIKSMDCFRFVFITGVSSYAQTSIFSGPNQFVNISFYDEYANCCGYTKDEIEHYFASQLVNAQRLTGLNHEQLINALSYHYDGYTYSKVDPDNNRVFSPVSVSLFLNRPEAGFENYWANTGALSSFFLKMMKLCNKTIASDLLKRLYQGSINQNPDLKSAFGEAITSFFPIFSLAINTDDENQFNSLLIKVDVENLIVKLSNVKVLSQKNAVAVMFQAGYLSIKKVVGSTAYLGLANHEVAQVLAKLLQEQLEEQEEEGKKPLSVADQHILYLLNNSEEVFTRLHQGGQSLCDLINDTFNSIDKEIFNKDNDEQVLTSILAFMLKATGYKALREVKSMFGIADIVIYKPNTEPLVPDVALEFRFARSNDNIVSFLKAGSKQVAERKYGLDFLNSDPHRYCIVLSNAIKGVGAISRIHRDGTYTTEYQNPKIGANGKVPIKTTGRSSSKQAKSTRSKAKPSSSSSLKQTNAKPKPSSSSRSKQSSAKPKPSAPSRTKSAGRKTKQSDSSTAN